MSKNRHTTKVPLSSKKSQEIEETKKLRGVDTDSSEFRADTLDFSSSSQDDEVTERFAAYLANHSSWLFATSEENQRQLGLALQRGQEVDRELKDNYIDLNDSKAVNGPKFDHIKKIWSQTHPANKQAIVNEYMDYLTVARPELGEKAIGFDLDTKGNIICPREFSDFLRREIQKNETGPNKRKQASIKHGEVSDYWSSMDEDKKVEMILEYRNNILSRGPNSLSEQELQMWRQDRLNDFNKSYDYRSKEGMAEFAYEVNYTASKIGKAESSSMLSDAMNYVSGVVGSVAGSALSLASLSSMFGFAAGQNSTESPTADPTEAPSTSPTFRSTDPTLFPTQVPSSPTRNPSKSPTSYPTLSPTSAPTDRPSKSPTSYPTLRPTSAPTDRPSKSPTDSPSSNPTRSPTLEPTLAPTILPSLFPTIAPSSPTRVPTKFYQSHRPTPMPTLVPTIDEFPTGYPTVYPTVHPSFEDNNNCWDGTKVACPPTGLPTIGDKAHDSNSDGSSLSNGAAVGVAVGGLALLLCTAWACCSKSEKEKNNKREIEATHVKSGTDAKKGYSQVSSNLV